jgi:threonine aldolase
VFLDARLGERGAYVRKTVTQLPSKMRFVAAQFNALLTDDLWISLATHSNSMAVKLYQRTSGIDGVTIDVAPVVNSVFPVLPPAAIEPLREWSFFWDWDPSRHQVRWMTAWDTTEADVECFSNGVTDILASCN